MTGRPHREEEFAAVKALLEAGADPTLGDSEGRTPLGLCGAQTNLKLIKEVLEKYVEQHAAEPGIVQEAKEDFERRSAQQVKQAALFAEKIAAAEAEAAKQAAQRDAQLDEVNSALDALKLASDEAGPGARCH